MHLLAGALLILVQGTEEGGDARQEMTDVYRTTIDRGSFHIDMDMDIEQDVQGMKITMTMDSDGAWQQPNSARMTMTMSGTMDDQPMMEEQQVDVYTRDGRAWTQTAGMPWTEADPAMMGGMQGEMMSNPMAMVERIMEIAEEVRQLDPEDVDGVRCVAYEITLSGDALVEYIQEMSGPQAAMLEIDPDETTMRYVTYAGADDRLIRRQNIHMEMVATAQGMETDMQMEGVFTYSEHGAATVEAPADLPE